MYSYQKTQILLFQNVEWMWSLLFVSFWVDVKFSESKSDFQKNSIPILMDYDVTNVIKLYDKRLLIL